MRVKWIRPALIFLMIASSYNVNMIILKIVNVNNAFGRNTPDKGAKISWPQKQIKWLQEFSILADVM